MPYLSKSKLPERLNAERHLVEAIRDKLDALANAQLKQDRPIGKRKQDTQPKRTKPKSITHLKNEIHLFLASVNIHPHRPEVEVEKANREESWLIRLDWDGKFHMPADTDYSEAYARSRQIISEQKTKQTEPKAPYFTNLKTTSYTNHPLGFSCGGLAIINAASPTFKSNWHCKIFRPKLSDK